MSLDGLKPARRQKLTESVAQQLLSEIRKLPAGTRVPSERELTQALGVGRSTVREAMNGLALLGVVEVRHGQGAFVTTSPPHEDEPGTIRLAVAKGVTHDLLEARHLIEVELTRLAAERHTEGDLREIESTLKRHAQALTESRSPVEPASTFHLQIADAAHNEVLASVAKSLLELMLQRTSLYERLPDFADWELRQHRHVYEAIRRGPPELAAKRMRQHVAAMAERYRSAGEA